MSDNMGVEAYPLQWPRGRKRTSPQNRRHATFRSGSKRVSVTVGAKRVRQALSAFTRVGKPWVIAMNTVVISSDVPVRNDGMPYGSAGEPADPGVAVYFHLRGKPHCLSCDRWSRLGDNLAAIASHLDAMRGQERWGVASVEEIFAGFKALPGGVEGTAAGLESSDAAAAFLARFGGLSSEQVLKDAESFKRCFKVAAIKLHPDANGGQQPAEWAVLMQAKSLMEKHHRIL